MSSQHLDATAAQRPEPPLALSLSILGGLILFISIGLAGLQADLRILLLIALAVIGVVTACVLGWSPLRLVWAMLHGVLSAKIALVIFLLIGLLIAALIEAGTVPTLIDWGLATLSPEFFLPTALLLCSVMSLATGTAWGTAGTIGVVLMSIGAHMGIPAAVVAGVVISGACFGDKMSLVSDTTNLAALSAGTTLYRHIHSMLYTTVPAYLLAFAAYAIFGISNPGHAVQQQEVTLVRDQLAQHYQLGGWALLPLAVLVLLSILRINAVWAMVGTIVTACAVALWSQNVPLAQLAKSLVYGASAPDGGEAIAEVLSRGGLSSMVFTLVISLLALALGGVLAEAGYLKVIVRWLLGRVRRTGSLVAASTGAGLVGNISMGEAYMSIVLGGQLFRQKYDLLKVDRAVLSRSLEEGATLTTPLIPWTTAGVFFATTLGVSTAEYLPYAWLNLINPIVGIAAAFLGFGLFTSRNRKQASDDVHGKLLPTSK